MLRNIKVPPLYASFLFDDVIVDKPHTSGTLIALGTCLRHALLYHVVLVKFYCDVITEAVTAYQYFDRHLLSKLRAFLAEKRKRRKVKDS